MKIGEDIKKGDIVYCIRPYDTDALFNTISCAGYITDVYDDGVFRCITYEPFHLPGERDEEDVRHFKIDYRACIAQYSEFILFVDDKEEKFGQKWNAISTILKMQSNYTEKKCQNKFKKLISINVDE